MFHEAVHRSDPDVTGQVGKMSSQAVDLWAAERTGVNSPQGTASSESP